MGLWFAGNLALPRIASIAAVDVNVSLGQLFHRRPGPGEPHRLTLAFAWNLGGSFLNAGSAFLLGVLLGRLLGPRPFGLVAAALLPISLGQLLIDQGVSAEVIQRPRLGADDLRHARRRQLLMGAGLAFVMAASAPLLAGWYHMPELRDVLLVLAPLFLVQALGQVPMALMKRHMHFRSLQGIQVGSYLGGYLGLGVPLAYGGKGVWALVAAQWGHILIQTALLLLARPEAEDHPGAAAATPPEKGGGFAYRVMATNLSNWALSNLAALLIGRQFGAVDLGLYNRGRNLLQAPTGIVTSSLQGVMFPATAEHQNDPDKVRTTFLRAVRALAWLSFAFTGCALAWAGPLVLGLYGQAWGGAVPILTPLLAALPFTLLMGLPGPVLLGLGVASVELRVQLGLGLATLPLLVLGGRYGLFPVLWVVVGIEALRWVLMTGALLPRLGSTWTGYLLGLGGPAAGGVGAFLAAWGLEAGLTRMGLPAPLRLLAFGSLMALLAGALWLGRTRWTRAKLPPLTPT